MATFAAHVAGETAYNKEAYHSQEIAHKAEYEPKDAAHFCTTSALIKPSRYQEPVAYILTVGQGQVTEHRLRVQATGRRAYEGSGLQKGHQHPTTRLPGRSAGPSSPGGLTCAYRVSTTTTRISSGQLRLEVGGPH